MIGLNVGAGTAVALPGSRTKLFAEKEFLKGCFYF